MDLRPNLSEWLRNLGYPGPIPEDLSSICNNSTKHIWDQLINNVAPKPLVEHIKKNVIVQRLNQKSLNLQHEYDYKIQEIENLKEKIRLENRCQELMLQNQDINAEIEELKQKNTMKEASIRDLKVKIKEHDQRAYLLESKYDMLENHLRLDEEKLQELQSITPVEREESCNNVEQIEETLENCAQKLQRVLEDNQSYEVEKLQQTFVPFSTTKKSMFSTIKMDLSRRRPNNRVQKALFTTPKIAINDNILEQSLDGSLGLLPDDFHKDLSVNTSIMSIIEVSTLPEITTVKKNYKHKIYDNLAVDGALRQCLHGNNAEFLSEILHNSINKLYSKLTQLQIDGTHLNQWNLRNNHRDIVKLHYVHIKTELEALMLKRQLQNLTQKISKRKFEILGGTENVNMENWLERKIKQIQIDASLRAIKKEIISNDYKTEDDELEKLYSIIRKTKIDTRKTMYLIKQSIDELADARGRIIHANNSVQDTIWDVKVLKMSNSWMDYLLEDCWWKELNAFAEFPLEYQRRCINTDPKLFYRDICIDAIPKSHTISEEDLRMLLDLLEIPFEAPEIILNRFLNLKWMMNVLKIRSNNRFETPTRKYSLEELEKSESYLSSAIEQLKSFTTSSRSRQTLEVGSEISEAMLIWLESPMQKYISSERTYQGQNYQYYYQKLKRFI